MSQFKDAVDHTIKAVSGGLTCAVLLDGTSNPKKLRLVKFVAATAVEVEDLIAKTVVVGADAATKNYEVAD